MDSTSPPPSDPSGDRAGDPVTERGPRLVPQRVSVRKFDEQIERWHANRDTYTRRGWVLLATGDLWVEVGFLQNVAMGGRTIPVMTACVRLDYWNFDLWPPSLTFLDPVTRQPAPPPVRAPDRVSPTEVRDALIDQHPTSLQPFLCLPGVREYHTHPQHSGDDWLLHRPLHEGDLAVVCERVWRRMARNVLGMSIAIQSLAPASDQVATQLEVNLLQGDADLVARQLEEQQAAEQAAAQQAFNQEAAHAAAQVAAAAGNGGGVQAIDEEISRAHAAGDVGSAEPQVERASGADEPSEVGVSPQSEQR